ncbi:MAG TPA: hypothetical protein VGO43_03825 [Pyrinomonadaceae bacterium]|nr:hypothetical protein [Pyrinomonadaceae bacterium]
MRKSIVILMVAVAFFAFTLASFAQTSRPWTAPKTGVWTVTAKDEEGIKWSGRLHLSRQSTKGTKVGYRGYFYWIDAERSTSGNEYLNGSFDRSSGKLRLHGYKAKSIRGELGTGDYLASGLRGRRFIRGSWSGENAVPGTWSAVWKSSR